MNNKHSLQEIVGGPEEVIFDATCFEENRSGKKITSLLWQKIKRDKLANGKLLQMV